jgi:hypothetical protein
MSYSSGWASDGRSCASVAGRGGIWYPAGVQHGNEKPERIGVVRPGSIALSARRESARTRSTRPPAPSMARRGSVLFQDEGGDEPVDVRAGEAREASLGHANCEAMERREWMPSFVKIFST